MNGSAKSGRKYKPARGFRITQKQAELIGASVEAIQAKRGSDVVTPAMFVDYARNPSSPAHGLFNWDVRSAAKKYWESQAQYFLRSYEVVIERTSRGPQSFRAMVTIGDDDEGFIPIEAVIKDESLKDRYKRELLEDLNSFCRKYIRFCALADTSVLGPEGKDLVRKSGEILKSYGFDV